MGRNFICYEPEYVENFQCDGTACGALCCRNWGITIDKETYHKYKLIPQRKLRQKILAAIDTESFPGEYRIKMCETRCPMLRSDLRCEIQKKCEEKALSNVCAQYPRRYVLHGENTLFRVLSVSCPIARELAFASPEAMNIRKKNIMLDRSIDLYKVIDSRIPSNVVLSVMMTGVKILQNRNYTFDERLFLLGLYLDKCDENISGKVTDDIWQRTADFYLQDDAQFWKNALEKVSFKYQQYFEFMFGLMDVFYEKVMVNSNRRGEIFLSYVNKAFDLEKKKTAREFLNVFSAMYDDYSNYVLQDKWYVLENYIVQEFWGEVVPFSAEARGMESSFIIYLVYYKMMEFLLISMAGVKKDSIVVADILELISMMSYYVTHVEEFESIVLDYIGADINNPMEMMQKLLIV